MYDELLAFTQYIQYEQAYEYQCCRLARQGRRDELSKTVPVFLNLLEL